MLSTVGAIPKSFTQVIQQLLQLHDVPFKKKAGLPLKTDLPFLISQNHHEDDTQDNIHLCLSQ